MLKILYYLHHQGTMVKTLIYDLNYYNHNKEGGVIILIV
jgi:hypothetical protein